MKEVYTLVLCLFLFLITFQAKGQSTSQTSFTTTGAGWFQVGKWESTQRGSTRVIVSLRGGSHSPQSLVIDAFKNWSAGLYVDAKGILNTNLKKVRITNDTNYYYLEVYFDRAITDNALLYLYDIEGSTSSFVLNSGVLPSTTGSVLYETDDLTRKTLIGNTIDARKDLLVNGNVGIGTISLNDKLTVAGNVNIGGNGNSSLKVRHVNGKSGNSSNFDNLYLNYSTGKDVWVGSTAKKASLVVNGDISIRPENGGVLTLFEDSSTRRNRIIVGADEHGAYIKSTYGSGGTDAISLRDSGNNRILSILDNSNVGIGTTSTGNHKLAVEGSIGAREIKVEATGWSDFVFYDDYQLPTLTEVENHIKEKGHLKDIPSAKEVETNGFYLGEMDAKLLQKIEELTLYTIEQEKKIEDLKKYKTQLDNQAKEIKELKNLLKEILELNKNN